MTAAPTTVSDGVVVAIHYTLKNDAGETLDSSSGGDPLEYLHGAGNIVPGLESALTGKQLGEQLEVSVAPADGYGERDPRGVQKVPRNSFPPGVDLQPGMAFLADGPDGEPVQVWISALEADRVVIDLNHPLAGVTLHFEVQISALRAATAEEIEHGHPHGPDGHGGHEHHGHEH
ncbi:MAG: peptidylprolyl isomerase [Planctomycetes bacterium]|nr:peptidylprolyl isomerase [Planctomycetota bacterium]